MSNITKRPPAFASDAEIKKVFSRFDADGDGKISPSELAKVSRAISPPASSSSAAREVAAMMDVMDADHDGFVDLGEFSEFHRLDRKNSEIDAELREAFDVYDLDGDGRITATELRKVLERIGEGCSADDCERMIASVDADGDGCVGFEEFKKMMCRNGPDAGVGSCDREKAKKE